MRRAAAYGGEKFASLAGALVHEFEGCTQFNGQFSFLIFLSAILFGRVTHESMGGRRRRFPKLCWVWSRETREWDMYIRQFLYEVDLGEFGFYYGGQWKLLE